MDSENRFINQLIRLKIKVKTHFYILLLIAWFFITPGVLLSQDRNIDSLNQVFKQCKTDTDRVKVLNKLAKVFSNINIDTSIQLNSRALKLAEKVNWQ